MRIAVLARLPMDLTNLQERSIAKPDTTNTPSVVIMHLNGRKHILKYFAGETLLETARRGQLPLGSGCERGDCGACMVSIIAGCVRMRANTVLSDEDVRSGITLACQSIPTSSELEIDLS
jgi:ferredoxin